MIMILAAGCSIFDPYVYKEDEFNRESETFFKEPDDRDFVTICYSPLTADTPRRYELAKETCGKYGKTAVYDGRSAGSCPVLIPVEAVYRCVP
jgi:hypothetical protein